MRSTKKKIDIHVKFGSTATNESSTKNSQLKKNSPWFDILLFVDECFFNCEVLRNLYRFRECHVDANFSFAETYFT